ALAITGSGAANGGNFHTGVHITSSAKVQATVTGSVILTGTGGGPGLSEDGVVVDHGATGAAALTGSVTVKGSASATGAANSNGVYLNGGNTTVSTASGNLSIFGTGGDGSGVSVYNSAAVKSSGGNVTLTGTGGGSGLHEDGVVVNYA